MSHSSQCARLAHVVTWTPIRALEALLHQGPSVETSIESDLLSEPSEPKGAQHEDQHANARRGQEAKRGNEHLAEEQNQMSCDLREGNENELGPERREREAPGRRTLQVMAEGPPGEEV